MIHWTRNSRGTLRGNFQDHYCTPCHVGVSVDEPGQVMVLGANQCAMFLHRDQLAALLPDLVEFVRTGKLKERPGGVAVPIARGRGPVAVPIVQGETP